MGNKVKRDRRAETGRRGAYCVSDLRQLKNRGIIPAPSYSEPPAHPPVDGLVWSQHARERFAQRIAPDLEPELLYDYLKGRKPMLAPYHVTVKLEQLHLRYSPYQLGVRDVCRVILDWKPHNPTSPDWATRGIWVVITVLPWERDGPE